MGTQGYRRCCHCGNWFRPHPRNVCHQRYCSKPECRKASKRASQRKWSRKNRGYFRGRVHVKRVQAWRRAHPGYWKRPGTGAPEGPADALQDLLISQGYDSHGVKVFRDCLSREISRPLQDLLNAQCHVLVGVASMVSGEALQENLGEVLTACYERGQRIGGVVPWMPPREVAHERSRSPEPATAAAGAAPVQLGGSPAGP